MFLKYTFNILPSMPCEPFGSSCLDFAWSNLKEDCNIDRGNLLEKDCFIDQGITLVMRKRGLSYILPFVIPT
jgi:hypothetical protein